MDIKSLESQVEAIENDYKWQELFCLKVSFFGIFVLILITAFPMRISEKDIMLMFAIFNIIAPLCGLLVYRYLVIIPSIKKLIGSSESNQPIELTN